MGEKPSVVAEERAKGFASPACSAHEMDDRYMGFAGREETLLVLNELLEIERARTHLGHTLMTNDFPKTDTRTTKPAAIGPTAMAHQARDQSIVVHRRRPVLG
jgi:hypothetical protein